jgi:Flp pilus assembly protein TadD
LLVNPVRLVAGSRGIMSLFHAFILLVLLPPMPAAQAGGEVNHRRLEEAVAAIGGGALPKAEALLNSVLAGAPRDADALNLLGVVRAQQQRAAEAERLFRRAIAARPAHVGAHINLGELLITAGREKEAVDVLLAAERLAPGRA